MKKIYTLILLAAAALIVTSCNEEWKEEQYEEYIAFRSPLNNRGVTEIYVPYTRKGTDGTHVMGEGRSNYLLPMIVSGSTNNQRLIKVHVAHDPDTLQVPVSYTHLYLLAQTLLLAYPPRRAEAQ